MPSAFLPDRAFIRISGPDAEPFLQNLITTDLGALQPGVALPGALLTPQGKIFFDFLIWRDADDLLIDSRADQLEALIRRLAMYKLRAPVTIEAFGENGATVTWGAETAEPAGVLDHRFALAGVEVRRSVGRTGESGPGGPASAYDALRILNGVIESGSDYVLQDAFPHDVLLDKSGGVSFKKGCYVGQEVVSRMHHRSTARRRAVIVAADGPLPQTGSDVTADGKLIGTLGTVAGQRGLAILRIDKAGEAMAKGVKILAGETPITVSLPGWTSLTFPSSAEES